MPGRLSGKVCIITGTGGEWLFAEPRHYVDWLEERVLS